MPSHISSCPSQVQLKQYIARFDALPDTEKVRLARELMVALRTSELRNNRCLQQALSFYERIRAQRAKR